MYMFAPFESVAMLNLWMGNKLYERILQLLLVVS
jgi:hypothetical protein